MPCKEEPCKNCLILEEEIMANHAFIKKLEDALRDFMDCHKEGGFVQVDEEVLTSGRQALSSSATTKKAIAELEAGIAENFKTIDAMLADLNKD